MNLNYEKKVHTNTKVHVQVQVQPWYTYGRVATYCDKTAFLNRLQNVQQNLEATTTLRKYEDFTGNAMRIRNVLFMSFYRNTNTNVRKDSATIAEIKTTFRKREGSKNGPADQHKRCTDCGGLNFDSESDLRNHASSTLSPA